MNMTDLEDRFAEMADRRIRKDTPIPKPAQEFIDLMEEHDWECATIFNDARFYFGYGAAGSVEKETISIAVMGKSPSGRFAAAQGWVQNPRTKRWSSNGYKPVLNDEDNDTDWDITSMKYLRTLIEGGYQFINSEIDRWRS